MVNIFKRLWIRATPWKKRTWKELGQPRGRTAPGAEEGSEAAHAADAEPEATLHIKVMRADGTVEHYDAPAEVA